MKPRQSTLSAQQIHAFYHDRFVSDQVADFERTLGESLHENDVVVDIGGGCGFFARSLQQRARVAARVIDTDPTSIAASRSAGIDANLADALKPPIRGDETIACFNLVLHHLVGASDTETVAIQVAALRAWQCQVRYLFVNEYVYQSYWAPGLAGRLIWNITSSRVLSAVAKFASRLLPSLRANTFGVGVRFRPAAEWRSMFREAGFDLVAHVKGAEEPVAPPRRLLLISSVRRDSFVLRPQAEVAAAQAGSWP